jgi:hypothetical protein
MKKKTRTRMIVGGVSLIILVVIYPLLNYGDTQSEALDDWLEEHKEEIEDLYWDGTHHYAKLNGQWHKLTFEEDFWGDWDVKALEVDDLPEGFQNG